MAEKKEQKTIGYHAFDQNNKKEVISKYDVGRLNSVQSAKASTNDPHTRHGYYPEDYYRQRPQDAMPYKFKDVVQMCRKAYLSVNVVRNVIDLMTDFACEDIKIIHPDKRVEAFFKVWMAKVGLKEAIDEFVRHFFVDGNVVVKRQTAKLSRPVEEQWMEKAMAAEEPEKLYKESKVAKREIPWRYTFLNIVALSWVGGEAARATGDRKLAFKLSKTLLDNIRNPSDPFQQKMAESLPTSIKQSLVTNNSDFVTLDMDMIHVSHNKKDSWEDWAPPFLYSILSDIRFKEKLRQAEISALDGVVNVIRLWKLGDHKEGFFPGEAPIDKLIDILQNNTGGGAIDIVWDSMIDMQEFYPPIEKILGSEKYEQVNRDILIGLGVPEVLIGGHGSNFSNSWIQLKTLVEKLKYVRDKVKDWLYEEIHLVCEAMDIAVAPKVRFNRFNLEDENIARKLVVGLLDRGVISVEAVLQTYGEDFLVEVERMRGEQKILKPAGIEPKGPFDPDPVLPGGAKKPPVKKKKGAPGRPSSTKDVSRKTRVAKPRRASASMIVKGLDTIDKIDEIVISRYTDELGVSNARKLTNEQREEINEIRNIVLACICPSDQITADFILEKAEQSESLYNKDVIKLIKRNIAYFVSENGKLPNLLQRKRIAAVAWAEYFTEI